MSVLPVLSCGSYAGATPPWMGSKGVLTSVMPTLDLNFAACNELDPRITFTRASSATYFNSNGVMQTANANVPRFDYDPVTGESKGLLIEEQRTNLLTYSEQFDNAAWTKTRSSISSNVVIAPDGTLTGDKIIANTANDTHTVYNNTVSGLTSSTYTLSVYAKAAEKSWLLINTYSGGQKYNYFNLSTGVLGTVATGCTNTITSVGNGWYRCTVTLASWAPTASDVLIGVTNANNSSGFAGDGYSGIYIWGAQLEAGSFPTSYIPTTSAQVTRSADAASMTGSNFSSWYNQAEGTTYVEYCRTDGVSGSSTSYRPIFGINSGGRLYYAAGTVNSIRIYDGTTESGNISTYSGYNKSSVYYGSSSMGFNVNGGNITTSSFDGSWWTTATYIGCDDIGRAFGGWIKKLAYYPKRLSDAELQGLTS